MHLLMSQSVCLFSIQYYTGAGRQFRDAIDSSIDTVVSICTGTGGGGLGQGQGCLHNARYPTKWQFRHSMWYQYESFWVLARKLLDTTEYTRHVSLKHQCSTCTDALAATATGRTEDHSYFTTPPPCLNTTSNNSTVNNINETCVIACNWIILDHWSVVNCHVMLTNCQIWTLMQIKLNHQVVILQLQFLRK